MNSPVLSYPQTENHIKYQNMIGIISGLLLVSGIVLIVYSLCKRSKNYAQYYKERNLKYYGLGSVLKNSIKMIFTKDDIIGINKVYSPFPKER